MHWTHMVFSRCRGAAALMALTATLVAVPASAELDGVPYLKLHVRTDSSAAIWAAGEGLDDGGTAPVVISSKISSQPLAKWYANWDTEGPDQIRSIVAADVRAAITAGAIPQLVPYMIPYRDCNSLSSGGAQASWPLPTAGPDPSLQELEQLATKLGQWESDAMNAWGDWISKMAAGIRDGLGSAPRSKNSIAKVIVLLEPDALALQVGDDSCIQELKVDGEVVDVKFDVSLREEHMRWAVKKLASAGCWDGKSSCDATQSNVKVFLDAGHFEWYDGNIGTIGGRLIRAGIGYATGFFTNTSNYQVTSNEELYGKHLIDWLENPTRQELGERHMKDGRFGCLKDGDCKPSIPDGDPRLLNLKGKLQVIDTSRNGVSVGKDTTGRGWPNWCDNEKARVGTAPTVYASHDDVKHVAARLWTKIPGEVDGCYDAPLPVDTANQQWAKKDVPALSDPRRVEAGTFDVDRACKLITGDKRGAAHIGQCGAIDLTVAPPAPTGLRATSTTSAGINPARLTKVQLEWNPSPGACSYMIQRGINGRGLTYDNGKFEGMVRSPGEGVGPATVWVDHHVPTDEVVTKLQYRVRARACNAQAYSNSSTITVLPSLPRVPSPPIEVPLP